MPHKNPEFEAALAHALELFSGVHTLRSRRMFGGAGIYSGGQMFALLSSDGALFLKADEEFKAAFKEAGSTPFYYAAAGRDRPVAMNYWRLPDEALEDPELAMEWAQKALDAAKRSPMPAGRRRQRAPMD
jgi:DNA transformation protein